MTLYGKALIVKANLFRRKKSLISNLLFLVLLFLIIILTISFQSSLSTYITNSTLNNVDCRSIFVETATHGELEKAMEAVSKIEHVVAVYPQDGHYNMNGMTSFRNNENMDGNIRLRGGDDRFIPKVIKGESFDENQSNVGIIPQRFYPSMKIESLSTLDKADYINGDDLIGKWITAEYGEYDYSNFDDIKVVKKHTYSFKVVGVYDSVSSYCEDSVCFIPIQDVIKINDIANGNLYDYVSEPDIFLTVVDKYENAQTVIDTINSNGYIAEIAMTFNTAFGNLIIIVGNILAVILIIICTFNLMFSLNSNVKNRTGEIGLLKCIGYTNKNLYTIIFLELGILVFAAIVISILILLLILFVFNNFVFINEIIIIINPIAMLVAFGIAILLAPISSILAIENIKKLSPIVAAKEEVV